jgi:hypothetical protein
MGASMCGSGTRTTVTTVALTISCVLLLAGVFGFGAGDAKQERADKWQAIEIVAYPSGLTGFLDKKTGVFYLYDGNVDKVIAIREIVELGKPMKRLKN